MELLNKNLKYLRETSSLNQAQLSVSLGFSRSAWNNYEKGKSKPSIDDFMKISNYFELSASELLEEDLSKGNLNEKVGESKNSQKGNLNSNLKGNLKVNFHNNLQDNIASMVQEPALKYGVEKAKTTVVPMVDISVAAGEGIYNSDHLETEGNLMLPASILKLGCTYLAVKVKGQSMSPTLQDGSWLIVRQMDRAEWAKMLDERVFVVVDTDGKSYLKRVKNRFKQGLIVLRSDNPDQASFPSFNLTNKEIASIWYAEWYLSAKMPNIHDQFYSRLQRLEDKVESFISKGPNK